MERTAGTKRLAVEDILQVQIVDNRVRYSGFNVSEYESVRIYNKEGRLVTGFSEKSVTEFQKLKFGLMKYTGESEAGGPAKSGRWICASCGDSNRLESAACKGCGRYR